MPYIWFILFLSIFVSVLLLMISTGFVTLEERHLMGFSQLRKGPNKVFFNAILLFMFDGLKNFSKDLVFINKSPIVGILSMPIGFFLIMILEFFCLPFYYFFFNFMFSLLFFLCLVGFSVYFIIIGGIFSKSKYSFLGSIRAASQNVSFEICVSIMFLCWSSFVHSFELVYDYFLFFFISFFIFFLVVLAELGRAPFDFTESESELVSGYNTEFGSIFFILFMLSEYSFLLLYSLIGAFQYFYCFYVIGFMFFVFLIFLSRCTFPRYRYDLLMLTFWKVLLPCSLGFLFLCYYIMFI